MPSSASSSSTLPLTDEGEDGLSSAVDELEAMLQEVMDDMADDAPECGPDVDIADVAEVELTEDGQHVVEEGEDATLWSGMVGPTSKAVTYFGDEYDAVHKSVNDLLSTCRLDLQEAIVKATERANMPFSQGDIALIRLANGSVFFFQWINTSNKTGRPITLDDQYRVIAIMAARVPVMTLPPDATILIGNTGVVHLRVGPMHRPEVEEWLVLYKKHQDYKSFCGPWMSTDVRTRRDLASKPWQCCVLCLAATMQGKEPLPDIVGSDQYACVVCCSTFHLRCAESLVDGPLSLVEFCCPHCIQV